VLDTRRSIVNGTAEPHIAATCRWATPTLFLTAPFWFEAERSPWACLRDNTPRILLSTESCATCSRWEPHPSSQQSLSRICTEYVEMPGLRLTRQQAQRLCSLNERTCMQLLDQLVNAKLLVRDPDGQYARLHERDRSVAASRHAFWSR
jgi:hypothetical protein